MKELRQFPLDVTAPGPTQLQSPDRTSGVEEVLTPEGLAALRKIANLYKLTEDEVIEAVSREAVRRKPIVVEEK